jgi:hypothetical protein
MACLNRSISYVYGPTLTRPYVGGPLGDAGTLPYVGGPLGDAGTLPYVGGPLGDAGTLPYVGGPLGDAGTLPDVVPYGGVKNSGIDSLTTPTIDFYLVYLATSIAFSCGTVSSSLSLLSILK